MALSAGTRIGPYDVAALIGAGGMGEVYRAKDTTLGRDVALKVLPEAFAGDPDRLARFEREARTLAALNHPNIAAVYGLERSAGTSALVMELVEGPTLADRIAQGAVPVDEALPIARQIAEALEAAHEQGIIHRDLKPANIKVRDDGTVKVLDFGLAKALEPVVAGVAAGLTQAPTITTPAMTRAGMILGTAAYMSPEQARGKTVDRRSDLWAFGCVLFEMLTGRRAFGGDEVSDTLAEIIKGEPDWNALPAGTPVALRRLLRRCLAKDPRARLSDAAVARLEIDEAIAPAREETSPGHHAGHPRRRLVLYAAVAGLAGIVGTSAAWILARNAPAAPPPMRFAVDLGANVRLAANARQRLAISRDGRRIAYAGTAAGNTARLYVREVGDLEAVAVRGIDQIGSIFFSPDGQWIGYNDTSSGAFKKVPVGGGPSATICEVPSATGAFRGATWGSGGEIVFATGGARGLMRVPDAGGMPRPLTTPPDGESHRDPHFLPDGRSLLFVVQRMSEPNQIAVASLDDPDPQLLLAGSTPQFTASGHLVFRREEALWAVGFDPVRRTLEGNAVPVLEGVEGTAANQRAQYDLSAGGMLVFSPLASSQSVRTLVWVDREGKEEPIPAPPRTYASARLSPDGSRIALDARNEDNDIWIWDINGQVLTRVTFDPAPDENPIWAPDGQRIVFTSIRFGTLNLFRRSADGTGVEERLTEGEVGQRPTSISPDGRWLALTQNTQGDSGYDVMRLGLPPPAKVEPLVQTPFFEFNAEVSPDGRWMAYQSLESGEDQIFVRPFPDAPSGRWQVSTAGGSQPAWSRDGRELFYLDASGRLMSVSVNAGSGFQAGTPSVVLSTPYFMGSFTQGRPYDVSRDGRRFLMIKEPDSLASGPQVVVVLNWSEELKRLVPVE